MSFSNLQLMRESRRDLAPHLGLGVLVAFVYILIVGIPSNIFPNGEGLVTLLLSGPLSLGFTYFSFCFSCFASWLLIVLPIEPVVATKVVHLDLL